MLFLAISAAVVDHMAPTTPIAGRAGCRSKTALGAIHLGVECGSALWEALYIRYLQSVSQLREAHMVAWICNTQHMQQSQVGPLASYGIAKFIDQMKSN
jgi:hypothetical protein